MPSSQKVRRFKPELIVRLSRGGLPSARTRELPIVLHNGTGNPSRGGTRAGSAAAGTARHAARRQTVLIGSWRTAGVGLILTSVISAQSVQESWVGLTTMKMDEDGLDREMQGQGLVGIDTGS
jgi:hypothetical protein